MRCIFFVLALPGCSTLVSYETNPFDTGGEDCNYVLPDAATWEDTCHQTRPYFEFGGVYTKVMDDYTSFDLLLSAAPEGDIGFEHFELSISRPDHWILEDLVTVEYPDGTVHEIVVDAERSGLVRIGCDEQVGNIRAGEEVVFVLTFDYSDLDTQDGDEFHLGFNREQTWSSENGEEQTSLFQIQTAEGTSESIGINF